MDWSALAAIAEVIGLILVVVSLLFVGYQLRQNTRQLQQDNLLKTIRGTLDTNWFYHRNADAFRVIRNGCADFKALPAKDQALFHSIAMDLSFYLELVTRMSAAGLVDPNAPLINERFFLALCRTAGGAQWWQMVRRTRPIPDEAIEFLQSRLDDPAYGNETLTDLQPWLKSGT